jgi:hypothetical protein
LETKAFVRQRIEAINGVSRTWFEWSGAERAEARLLVVEVDFDTDPNAPNFRRMVLEAIEEVLSNSLQDNLHIEDERPVLVDGLRIVPRH